jgi:hypothetical protein
MQKGLKLLQATLSPETWGHLSGGIPDSTPPPRPRVTSDSVQCHQVFLVVL